MKWLFLIFFVSAKYSYSSENLFKENVYNMAIVLGSVRKVSSLDSINIIKLKKRISVNDFVFVSDIYPQPICSNCFKRLELTRILPVNWFLKIVKDNQGNSKFIKNLEVLEGTNIEFKIGHYCLNNELIIVKFSVKLNQKDHPNYGWYGSFDKVLEDYLFVEMCFK